MTTLPPLVLGGPKAPCYGSMVDSDHAFCRTQFGVKPGKDGAIRLFYTYRCLHCGGELTTDVPLCVAR
jgi:hypothetical protein